jgi:hypothetical protein
MDYTQNASTTADIQRAWTALAAVLTLPDWTVSITSITPLDGPDLLIGHRFRIKQPGLPPVVWRVSEVREGESFTWEAHSPGVHTVAHHRLSRNADGTTEIALGLHQTGALAGLVALFTAAKTRRYMGLEAAGLKAAAEAVGPAGGAVGGTGGLGTGGLGTGTSGRPV